MALTDARGESGTWGAAWRSTWRHAGSNLYVGLVPFSAGWLAATCLAAPGLILALGWWVARPAVVEEDRSFAAALRRSWRLTEGYRGKALGLWVLFLLLWGLGVLNLHLLLQFLATTVAQLLGIDTSALQAQMRATNQVYPTLLGALTFILIDPLKTAADAVFYLDLRTRREGADLHQRLRALRTAALSALVLACLLAPARGFAIPLEGYRQRVHALRKQVAAAKKAEQVDPVAVADLRSQLVELPGGQKISVENEWLRDGVSGWQAGKNPGQEKEALLRRLEGLERSLSGLPAGSPAALPAAPPEIEIDPKAEVQKLLQEPEFQPLAERPELRDLLKNVQVQTRRNWWQSFWDWLQKHLFKPPDPKVQPPNWTPPDLSGLRVPFLVLLGVVVLVVLALIVRWVVERPIRGEARKAVVAGAAPPLEASATENALDHTVDEWELFAQQWLSRGDLRQAVRALYLATLVHLHRERRIDYNRAFTNWVYVRQFRGEAEQKGTLQQLTRTFDEVWYGERECLEEQYRAFERGVRDLGTPAPAGGPARG